MSSANGETARSGPVLIGDARVTGIAVADNGEPLVALDWMAGPAAGPARLVRAGVAERLAAAQRALPRGLRLHLSEGYRAPAAQQSIVDRYAASLLASQPRLDSDQLAQLLSRYVAPPAVAPHVSGAAVDVTLADAGGHELWLGCPLDATPEESRGACYFDAPGIDAEARARRTVLAAALRGAGLVNYPTEWWHWSYGDRYWAFRTGADQACYGLLPDHPGAAARQAAA